MSTININIESLIKGSVIIKTTHIKRTWLRMRLFAFGMWIARLSGVTKDTTVEDARKRFEEALTKVIVDAENKRQ